MSEMNQYYEIVVFTAGLKDYADWVINDFDTQGYITHRLYRDHTKLRNGIHIKDLSRLGRNLQRTIIIDNIQENFMSQNDNGIHIKGWYNDPADRELDKLLPFLKSLVTRKIADVRNELRILRIYRQCTIECKQFGSPS